MLVGAEEGRKSGGGGQTLTPEDFANLIEWLRSQS